MDIEDVEHAREYLIDFRDGVAGKDDEQVNAMIKRFDDHIREYNEEAEIASERLWGKEA